MPIERIDFPVPSPPLPSPPLPSRPVPWLDSQLPSNSLRDVPHSGEILPPSRTDGCGQAQTIGVSTTTGALSLQVCWLNPAVTVVHPDTASFIRSVPSSFSVIV